MSARATGWSLAALLAVTGCGRGCGGDGAPASRSEPADRVEPASAPDTGGSPTLVGSGAIGRYADLPVPADYEAEAEATIDATNYRQELERLERNYVTK